MNILFFMDIYSYYRRGRLVEISRIIVDKYSYVGMKLQFHFKDVFIIGSENCYILPLIF